MRFIGNKESIVNDIEALLDEKQLLGQRLSFFDAFTGSGSVADHFKQYYDITINDNLTWSVLYSRGRICASSCQFLGLGCEPIEFFNNSTETRHGFMYNNYSPANSTRMYFTPENAERIDYFRWQIEEWKNAGVISYDEYCYLLACLVESVSSVSNTSLSFICVGTSITPESASSLSLWNSRTADSRSVLNTSLPRLPMK